MKIEKAKRIGWVRIIVPAGPAAPMIARVELSAMAEKMGATLTGPAELCLDALVFGDGSHVAYQAPVTEL